MLFCDTLIGSTCLKSTSELLFLYLVGTILIYTCISGSLTLSVSTDSVIFLKVYILRVGVYDVCYIENIPPIYLNYYLNSSNIFVFWLLFFSTMPKPT